MRRVLRKVAEIVLKRVLAGDFEPFRLKKAMIADMRKKRTIQVITINPNSYFIICIY